METIIKKIKQIYTKYSCKTFKTLCIIVFITGLQKVNGQVSEYAFTEDLAAYVPLSVSALDVTSSLPWDDAVIANIPLGFTFVYDGLSYTQCNVSTNGFITFGATLPAVNNYLPLSTNTAYPGVISGLGMNLISNGEHIRYETQGTAPNRVFIVEWKDAVRSAQPGNFNFQIRLAETTNTVQVHYGTCAPQTTTAITTQIGLRGPNTSFPQGNVKNRSFTANVMWTLGFTVPGTAATSSVRTSDLAYPEFGLEFTWSPQPPCTTPAAFPTGLNLGQTSINHNSINGNNFTAASPAPSGYLVLRSLVNTPPTAVTIPNRTFPTATIGIYSLVSFSSAVTFNQTGLASDTTYYYWVIPFNRNCQGAPVYNFGSVLSGNATTCTTPTATLAATSVTGNDFIANWNPVASATSYAIDVSTSNVFASFVPGYSNLNVGNVTSFTVTGLNPLTTYYYRIRAIGGVCSVNSNTTSVSTPCGYYYVPYSQNFDTTTPGFIPSCYNREDGNTDGTQWAVSALVSASSPRSIYINKNVSAAMDDWFFLPGIQLTGGVTYRLFFRYNTGGVGLYSENLRVRMGSGTSSSDMNITLLDLPGLVNTIFQPAFVDFSPVSNGIYYLGFQGYSAANQSFLAVDDINITIAPTCFEPLALTVTAVGINDASFSWTEPSPAPVNGYEYYVSQTNTPPGALTTPTGSVGPGITTLTVSGLNPSSQYYIWVRGNCGPTDKSIWSDLQFFSTDCIPPVILSSAGSTRCGFGTQTISATANVGSIVEWYDAPTGGLLLASGNSYTTPIINTTTTYYAQAKASGGIVTAGSLTPLLNGGSIGVKSDSSFINLSVSTATRLLTLDIFPITSGQTGIVEIKNSLNVVVASYSFVTSATGGFTAQTLPLGFDFVPGNYTINLLSVPASGLIINVDGASYPYTNSVASINGNGFDNSFYLYFYNLKFTTECLSTREPVTATVTAPPAISFSAATSTICEGDSTASVTVSGSVAYDSFVWSPNTNISGDFISGFTFNPTTTTVYSLTASQSGGSLCTNIITHTVNVNPAPSSIVIVPAAVTICEGTVQSLLSSVGAVGSVNLIDQDFNGATNDWIVTNNSTGGTSPADAAWMLQQSPYTYTSPYWNTIFSSNDVSQFYFANSDAQGGPTSTSITRTTLQSPTFSLVGYTSATINFWHYLRYISNNIAAVEVSTDGGTTWVPVLTFTGNIGTPTGFVNATASLNAFLGSPSVTIRFNYYATWDYGWAIDNVLVFGDLSLEVVWTPTTDLFTDAAGTIPYVAGTPLSSVFAKPNSTITYTGTVSGVNGCSTSNTSTITVDTPPIGGTLTGAQILCGSITPSDISLGGNVGTIIRWESADDAAFTINVTPIANTTNTLTSVQMGAISSIKYFRAVTGNGVCPVAYSDVVAVEYPSTTWNGTTWSNGSPDATKKVIFAGNFTSTGDIEACSIEVQATRTVTIASGHTLTVSYEVTVLGTPATTNLIFQNTASLIQLNNVVNSGSIRYIRNATPMVRNDYTYWSSPVAGQVLNVFSPLTNPSRYYVFDNASYNWLSVPGASSMIPAKGYIIRAPSNYSTSATTTYVGQFVGVPNNGDYSIPIVVNTAPDPDQDRNLIGNPYPSAIDADLLLAANLTTLQGSFYFWTHNTPITNFVYTANDYAVYNQSGGTAAAFNSGINNNPPNQFIAAGQGFFVQGLNSGTLTFTNAMRVAGNNASFYRNSQQNTTVTREKHRVWLNLINTQGAFKQLLAGYIQDATNAMDNHFDSEIAEAGNVVSFYSVLADKKLAIQGRALPFSETDFVPLGYRTSVAGTYAIQLADFDGLFALGQAIFLEDKLLNVVHDLRTSNYEFTTDIGTVEDRFVLKFQNETLSIPSVSLQNIIVIKNQNTIDITASPTISLKEVKVFDMRGRLITTLENINASTAKVTNLNIANQLILIQITDVEGKSVTKKIVY